MRAVKLILIYVVLLTTNSLSAQAPNEEGIRSYADSLLIESIGQCLFENYIEFRLVEYDTVVKKYDCAEPNDPKCKDTSYVLYDVSYDLVVYGEAKESIMVEMDTGFNLLIIYAGANVEEVLKESDKCDVISESALDSAIKTMKEKDLKLDQIILTENGITVLLRFNPQTKGFCIGLKYVSLHTGETIENKVTCPNF